MDKKYDVFIKLLNFNPSKYTAEKVFKDFISLYAISLSNKVVYNEENGKKYKEIYNSYDTEGQCNFYALASELGRLFCEEKEPYDILGEIYEKVCNKSYLRLLTKATPGQEVGKKLQGIMNINKKANNGKMIETNCGSGAMILAYASTLKIFKLDYKIHLQVTAIDSDILNVFMTYIQLHSYGISATVIWIDEKFKNELMRLYTPLYEDEIENLMVA